MNTLTVGTGPIGAICGWALTRADVDITHLVCPGKLEREPESVSFNVVDEEKPPDAGP